MSARWKTVTREIGRYVLITTLTLVSVVISLPFGAGLNWGVSLFPIPPWWIWPIGIIGCILSPILIGLRGLGELLMWVGIALLLSALLAMSLINENYQLG